MNIAGLSRGIAAGILTLASSLVFTPTAAAQSGQVLTGTTRLACEAILCLSSSVRPSECTPSLNHYFAILVYGKSGLDWGATIAARHAFLSMCPVVTSPGMPELIDAISKGAGRCDAKSLNTRLQRPAFATKARWVGGDAGYEVERREFMAISDVKPLYCQVYDSNEYTLDLSTKYVGTPFKGGFWVDSGDYQRALSQWQAKQGNAGDDGWEYFWGELGGTQSPGGGN